MRSTIAIAISTLALGTALTAVPALAQNVGPANGSTSGCVRFQTACSDTPYPMNQPAAGATAQQDQYNGQQRAQRTGSAGNTERWEARSAALGDQGTEFGSNGQYGGGPYYDYASGPSFASGPSPDAIAACQARFRSYDPATGTYLGFDGIRHACP